MLYEIAGTNARILGTMHYFPAGPQRWVEPVRKIYGWAERIYVEMKAERGFDIFKQPARLMARDLPADLRASVEPHWPREQLGDMEHCSALSVCLFANNLAMPPTKVDGIEAAVRAWLGSSGDVLELETPEDFVQAAHDVPLDDLLFSTRFVLSQDAAEGARNFEAQARAWRVHDLAKLERIARIGTTEAMRRALFEVRNRKWAEIIAREAKSPKRTLVLCGAGHLCGPNNLRDVLATAHGFRLARMMM
ncbi:TraB/GumN family protein [Variovorax ureilyticus]|uniref:TraB/GumN family protein n=1 Tax=Variovorax ureilyticus TaxID=1836198 RepID=A0ABU8VJP5_9BURK